MYDAIGSNPAQFGPLMLAAFQGRESDARSLIDAMMSEAMLRGQGAAVTAANWAHAVLCNGLAQYEEALTAASVAAEHQVEFTTTRRALVELVEAGSRSGAPELARDALEQLAGDDTSQRHRLGARCRGALARAPERWRRGGAPLPRGARAAFPYPGPRRSRSRTSVVRRVAPPRAPARRCARSTDHGA